MHATQYLQEHIDVSKLLEHYEFEHMRQEGDIIRCSCKLHGGNNSSAFVMRVTNGLWWCHTGDCGGGDIYTLVQRMEECSFAQAVEFVATFFDVDISNYDIINQKAVEEKELKMWVRTMQSRRKSVLGAYEPQVEMRKVTKFREYTPETLEHFGLQYAPEIQATKREGGTYTLKNRLAFPIRQDGIQIGISFRRIKNADFPKWLHQPANMETRNLLYNYDATSGQAEVIVCEGMPDVWAFHELGLTAVATFGAHLTDEQYKMLVRTGADIVLAYDGDEAGQNANIKAYDMLKLTSNVKYIPFEAGEDPDNLPREELWTRYENKCYFQQQQIVERSRSERAKAHH